MTEQETWAHVPGTRQTWCRLMYVYLLAHNKHWNPSLSADVVRKARGPTHTKELTDHCHQTKVHVWAVWRRPTLGITYSVNYLVWTRDPHIFCIIRGPMIADAYHNPRTPIRSFRTRNLAPHTTGQAACRTLRRKESSIMADAGECWKLM